MSVKQTGTPQFTPNAGVIFGFDPSNSNITNALKINSSGSLLTTATTSGVYNSTPPTVTNGSTTPLQTDANGNLKIAGSFSASVSSVYNSSPPTFSNGATTPLQSDVNGNLKVVGSVAVSNLPSTQAVSASSLPLPTGAATAAGVAAVATALGTPAQDGTDATGVTAPTGGVGIRGWLSGNYSKLTAIATALAGTLTTVNAAGSAIIGKVGIDQTTPGVTNAVAITAINPSTIYSGQQATTTSAAALPSQALVNGVIIKAKTTNTAVVYVGPSGVTASTGYPLAAGEAISYGATNLSTIYIIGTNTSDGVSFTGN